LVEAQSSGDQFVQDLKNRLKKLQEEYDAFKAKSASDFDKMQN